jgi:hypothetical protein
VIKIKKALFVLIATLLLFLLLANSLPMVFCQRSNYIEWADVLDTASQSVFTGITGFISYATLPIPPCINTVANWLGTTINGIFFQVGTSENFMDGVIYHEVFWEAWSGSESLRAGAFVDPNQSVTGRYFAMLFNNSEWDLYVEGSLECTVPVSSEANELSVDSEHQSWNFTTLDPNVYVFSDIQVETQFGWIPFFAVPSAYDGFTFTSSTSGNIYFNHYGQNITSASSFEVGEYLDKNDYSSPYMGSNSFSANPYYPTPSTLPLLNNSSTPSVTISPTSVTMGIDQSQLFTSTVSAGTPPYSYQWYLNDTTVSGANSSNWTFAPTSAGSYTVYVKVTDSVGIQATSNVATVHWSSVVPEFPAFLIMPVFMMATLLAVIVYRRKRT